MVGFEFDGQVGSDRVESIAVKLCLFIPYLELIHEANDDRD